MRAAIPLQVDNPTFLQRRFSVIKRKRRSRFPDLCVESVDLTYEHQSLEVTLLQPGLGGCTRLDNRAQLIWVASKDNICVRIGENHDWNHRKGFLRLCSFVDDYVTEVPAAFFTVSLFVALKCICPTTYSFC